MNPARPGPRRPSAGSDRPQPCAEFARNIKSNSTTTGVRKGRAEIDYATRLLLCIEHAQLVCKTRRGADWNIQNPDCLPASWRAPRARSKVPPYCPSGMRGAPAARRGASARTVGRTQSAACRGAPAAPVCAVGVQSAACQGEPRRAGGRAQAGGAQRPTARAGAPRRAVGAP